MDSITVDSTLSLGNIFVQPNASGTGVTISVTGHPSLNGDWNRVVGADPQIDTPFSLPEGARITSVSLVDRDTLVTWPNVVVTYMAPNVPRGQKIFIPGKVSQHIAPH